jgi:sugar-specific transcriptional regulator TrmB
VLALEGLAELGFTSLEAEAYCALLTSGPATAYRVAKQTGRPTANTYQAMATLLQRGVVEADEGEPRRYRALDPDDMLRLMDRRYARGRDAAEAALRRVPRRAIDESVYRIENVDQLLDRARQIIGGASEILLIDMFPAVVEEFADALTAAAERGVMVAGLIYSVADVSGATLVKSALSSELIGRWPGQQLTVIGDARHYVTALLSDDLAQVLSAFSSDSAFLACLQHSGLSAEIRLNALGHSAEDRFEPISLLNAYPEGLTHLIGERMTRED